MFLKELIENIVNIAKTSPNINSTYVGDVFEINQEEDVEYSCFILTQQDHQVNTIDDNTLYRFNFFYVDRLTADEGNRLDVQSTACEFLKWLITTIEGFDCIAEDVIITPFKQRFNDVCAGAYATLSVRVDNDNCGDAIKVITERDLRPITIKENGEYNGLFDKVVVDVEGGGKEPIIEPITITQNGTYTAPKGTDGYNPIEVNVESREPVLEDINITQNGVYTPSEGVDGFGKVDVSVDYDIHLQKKEVEITTKHRYDVIRPDSGYDGLSEVVVKGNFNADIITITQAGFNALTEKNNDAVYLIID